jgi:hypothetical protein
MAVIRTAPALLLALGLACTAEPSPARPVAAVVEASEPVAPTPAPPTPLPPPQDIEAPAPMPAPAGSVQPPAKFFGDNACRKALCQESPRCCQDWTDGCDGALLRAAYMTTNSTPTTGRCYYHDRSACPTCACPYYVKVDAIGFDGGTGCLDSREATIVTLLDACATGRCG